MAKRDKGFSQRCTVCVSNDVSVINLALARGCSVPALQTKFPRLSVDSLRRHFHNHLSGPVLDRLRVKALAGVVGKGLTLAELTANENETILSQIVVMKGSLIGAIQAAEAAGLWPAYSSLVGRLRDYLVTEAQILGQVQTGHTTVVNNYLSSESFIAVRSALIVALRPFPEASRAVARTLLQIESKPVVDVIDVQATDIASGAGQGVSPNVVDSCHNVVDSPAPAIIRTESYCDSITTEMK